MDRERCLQKSLRQGHSSECEINWEAYVQGDNLAGSLVQTSYTLQLTLCVGQRVMKLSERKPLRRGRLHGQLALETRLSPRTSQLCLVRGAATYDIWEL
jgi:hypothetical protein